MQDRHGFMWFTTQAGLNRYDGYEVKTYSEVPFDTTSLSSESWLFGMSEDAGGRIWVATRGQGVTALDPKTDRFERFRHDPSDSASIADGNTTDVLVDKHGSVWVTTDSGLCRYLSGKRFECYKHDPADSESLVSDSTRYLFEDSSGFLWVTTRSGLSRMDPAQPDRFESFLLDHRVLGRMLERPEEPDILWLTDRRSLLRFDVQTGHADSFPIIEPEEKSRLTSICQDPTNGNVLWVGSFGTGLGRFDLRTKSYLRYQPDANERDALTNQLIYDIYADRSGVIWVGTLGSGVVRFDPSAVGFSHIASAPGGEKSLPAHSVWDILETRGGVLWIVSQTEQGGRRLSTIDRRRGRYVEFQRNGDGPGGFDAVASDVMQDSRGTIWVSTFDRGLARYDPDANRFHYYRHDPNDPSSISDDQVVSLLEDQTGSIWLGMYDDLNRFDPVTEKFEGYDIDPSMRDGFGASCLSEDQTGAIWMCSPTGLARLDPVTGRLTRYRHDENDRTTIASDHVLAILERRVEPGIIWVGTSGGLGRLDTETGRFDHFTVQEGLPNSVVYNILEDERGRLWMSTNRGLSRFDPETSSFRNYGMESGLQALEFNSGAAYKGPNGEMFFGGINGVNAFFPNELIDNAKPPRVAVVDLKLKNRSVRETGTISLSGPIEDVKEIEVAHDQTDLRFDFVAFHYQHPELNEFAYKLEGFNEDWVYAGRERSAAYTNLDPGEYVFRVKAANSDGVWNEEGASVRIIVDPPFWATWWFRLLAVAGFGGILYLGYSFRVRQIAEHNRALEDEVEKRTAELRESHSRIAQTNEQLEQSHTIVEAINQETSFRRLLTKILEEARVIPGVEKATALIRMPDDLFHVRASSGWDVDEMQHIRLTRKDAHARYVEQAEEVGKNIFVAKNVIERAGSEQMEDFGRVASFLVLRVVIEGDVTAYLVFDNLTNPDAFQQRDVALIERLREHIQSAFIKTRILEDLQSTLDNLRLTQDRLVQSEKMASLGQLTAGIAHEIKNPLNFVNNFSEVTADIAADIAEEIEKHRGEMPASLLDELEGLVQNLTVNSQKVAEHGKRADAIVTNMLEHSKVGEGQRQPTSLNELLDEYVTLAVHGLEARGGGFKAEVVRDFDDRVGQVDIVPQDMGRVFMNLLSNAFDALREHGAAGKVPMVSVSTARVDGGVEIRVADNGPGIPEKVRLRIFEPFFTTKPTGSGTGLGLSMSYDIVTKGHGGTLEVLSEEGAGATFVVRLPI